jgi:hypothetical protein
MDVFEGVQSWTQREISAKEEAIKRGASRSLVNIVKGAAEGEFEIVHTDGDTQEADWTYLLSAQNHLLSQLNFPNKLKPFLDTIISSACGNGELEFSATNLEIGQKSRSGRDACSDKSMEKWVSRQKRLLDEWMAYKSFYLVGWQDGEYDFELNKRYPTRYQVFFNKYVVKAANLAKTKFYWGKGKDKRAMRNRALRESARRTLQEIPEAPNLRLKPPKTLSEEQKFDRRHHSMLTFMEKNRDALRKVGLDDRQYFEFLAVEIGKIASNSGGMIGKILTPEKDEPDHKSSVWQKIKTGAITEDIETASEALDIKIDLLEEVAFNQVDYAFEATKTEEKEIQTPQFFADGEWFDSDNKFGGATQSVKQNEPKTDQGDILSTKGTFLSGSKENADKTGAQADFDDFKHQGDIFVPLPAENEESVKHSDDFTDWFNDAAEVPKVSVLAEDLLQVLFESWFLRVKELIPDLSPKELWKGAWQVYLDLEFATEKQLKAYRELENIRAKVLAGTKDLTHFRAAFAKWVAMGATYYQNGTSVPQSAAKLAKFAERLEKQLLIDDG